MMHGHSCKACSVNGRPATIFITAGEPQPAVEDENNQQLVPSSMRSTTSLPLVVSTVGAAMANPPQQYMQHLIHPCGCMHRSTMHADQNLYLQYPHHHNVPTCCNMELVPACGHTQTYNHAPMCSSHIIQLPHAHHHQRPLLPLPEPKKPVELLRKFGSDAYGLHAPALSNAKVIDVPPLSVCRSISPVCVDKQLLPAQASKNMQLVESLCCAAHMCSLPTLSQAHTDADDASNQRKPIVDRCQIHPHCVAPTAPISTFKGFLAPQAPPKAAVANSPTCNNTVVIDHCKQGPFADQNGDDFWKGASNNQQERVDDDAFKGGRGANGNGWRGGCNSRVRGSSHQTTNTWNASKDDYGGNNDPWNCADGGNGNGRGGRGRGRGCGRGRGGSWQQIKRKREGDDADWGGPKTNTGGEKSMEEGHGWDHSNNWGKPNNNSACNGW
ncbi:hypothetical protein L7F22_043237 [Adiantum nelumboides]|nr:hypothetical protein [Adiantum nelumboides]